jgi:hypothetical protein
MAPLKTSSVMLVLLLALILPLQSFASWSCGAHDAGSAAAQHHCANDSGKAQTGAEPHHHCGTCCAAAIALMPFRWTPPPVVRSEASLPVNGSPPRIALDRLDRPPRLTRS